MRAEGAKQQQGPWMAVGAGVTAGEGSGPRGGMGEQGQKGLALGTEIEGINRPPVLWRKLSTDWGKVTSSARRK